MDVEVKRTVTCPHDAPEAVKREVLAQGGLVLPAPPAGTPPHATAVAQPPAGIASPSVSPSEGAAVSRPPRRPDPQHPADCRHDKEGAKLLPVVLQSGTPIYAVYCVRCGSLGPTTSRQPSLAAWMSPG